VKWTPGTENDDVVDVRDDSNASGGGPRGGGGSGFGGGGGLNGLHLGGGGMVVVIIIGLVLKFMSSSPTSSTTTTSSTTRSSSTTTSSQSSSTHRTKANDPDAELVDYIKFTLKDIQDTFDVKFRELGKPYTHAKLYIFTSVIDTACGRSSSEIGPFYCPGDNHAYIDLSFYRDLRDRFGAPGNFAQAYVLAHELGHHVQNLLGIDAKVSRTGGRDRRSRNAMSVKQELQADCFAGVWGNGAKSRNLLEAGDIEGALTAAAAIGDDRLEKQAGIPVDSETFTHGSSAQRMKWFRRGFETGRFDQCDTFTAEDL
jgi:predicted metalloprotease